MKWFNDQKGFGFIGPDDGSKDVFVHISAVERAGLRSLTENQAVSYELTTDRKSGKRHQLRVHMLALGLPLEGDLFYPEALRGPGAPEDFSQALQLLAQRIAFTDPVTGAERVFESQRSLRDAPSTASPEKN